MTYTNQLMNFETHQLKLHLPDKLFTDCSVISEDEIKKVK